MFLIDDLLLLPFRGMMFVFKQIHLAAEKELEGEGQSIRARLTELYMLLETGRITEEEFDTQEKELLDRLEHVDRARPESRADEPEAPPDGHAT